MVQAIADVSNSSLIIYCECGAYGATAAGFAVTIVTMVVAFLVFHVLFMKYHSKLESICTRCTRRKEQASPSGSGAQIDEGSDVAGKSLQEEAAEKGVSRGRAPNTKKIDFGGVIKEVGGLKPPTEFKRNTAYVQHEL